MPDFVRETRYFVAKINDAESVLDHEELRILSNLMEKVEGYRIGRGKEPLVCVVVQSNWPNYEEVWRSVERVAKGEGTLAKAIRDSLVEMANNSFDSGYSCESQALRDAIDRLIEEKLIPEWE